MIYRYISRALLAMAITIALPIVTSCGKKYDAKRAKALIEKESNWAAAKTDKDRAYYLLSEHEYDDVVDMYIYASRKLDKLEAEKYAELDKILKKQEELNKELTNYAALSAIVKKAYDDGKLSSEQMERVRQANNALNNNY